MSEYNVEIELYNDDCLKVLPDLEKDSVDLVITSPPYYNAMEYSQWDNYEDYLDFLKEVFKETYRVLKEGRYCVVNISPVIEPRKNRNTESKRYAIPFHLVSIMENLGYVFLEDIIWEKPLGSAKNRNGNFFVHRKPLAYKPNIVHEYVLVFRKKSDFLIDKLLKDNMERVENSKVLEDDYERSTIWKLTPKSELGHPAVFPESLSDRIIKYYSLKGDTVLDMFLGSGTSMVSSYNNDRSFIGIELDKKYFNEITDKLDNL